MTGETAKLFDGGAGTAWRKTVGSVLRVEASTRQMTPTVYPLWVQLEEGSVAPRARRKRGITPRRSRAPAVLRPAPMTTGGEPRGGERDRTDAGSRVEHVTGA